ncbi:hypothetical protein CARUB_v10015537mg [Capsella rubella]|uniref:FKB95-like N-terminal Kelch domain-containing protein n=1 Tax=Capsella rubella TaxID=81985 RepID=R0G9P8_9BRAS|nr:hypothetical protein CARUB_v10015537mg [Capsella rubella]
MYDFRVSWRLVLDIYNIGVESVLLLLPRSNGYLKTKHKHSDSYCEIESVLYSAADGAFKWYDSQERQWRDLKGFDGLPELCFSEHVRLADYGGKMEVMRDADVPYSCIRICCAEIALQKLNTSDISGNVEWIDRVFTVFDRYTFVNVIAATV